MAAASKRSRPRWTTPLIRAAQAYQSDGRLSGLATGLKDLDAKMGGLQPTDLIIIAGRPGMGKTSLATNIAFNVASAYDRDTTGRRLAEARRRRHRRLLLTRDVVGAACHTCALRTGEVPSSSIRRGEIGETDFSRLLDYRQKMRRLPLFIDQTGALSIAQLAARARRLKRQRGLHLVIVDYIQLMQGRSQRAAQNRVQEITEITTGLKALAKELNVPVVALSQLSRGVENRDEKRPQLSDLRESGSIEQDADVVMFVYREEYYLKNKEPRPGTDDHLTWESEMRDARGKAEVIIAKQRHGPTGTVAMTFQGEFTRFFDLAERSHLPHQSDVSTGSRCSITPCFAGRCKGQLARVNQHSVFTGSTKGRHLFSRVDHDGMDPRMNDVRFSKPGFRKGPTSLSNGLSLVQARPSTINPQGVRYASVRPLRLRLRGDRGLP